MRYEARGSPTLQASLAARRLLAAPVERVGNLLQLRGRQGRVVRGYELHGEVAAKTVKGFLIRRDALSGGEVRP